MASVDAASPVAPRRLFERLKDQEPDSLLALIGQFQADPRETKIDLGVGVYRDRFGHTPVMRSVKQAERLLLERQTTKAYLGPEGDPVFVDLLAPIVFGRAFAGYDRLTGIQTPGGTGALRLAAELLTQTGAAPAIWLGLPSWPNHAPILKAAGLKVETYPYFEVAEQRLHFAGMLAAFERARPGDVVLLHGCCHNPTGAGLELDQWRQVADVIAARGLVPLLDLAYQGLGQGLEADAAGVRLVIEAADQALLAYSCDKNWGLYRERTGALFALANDRSTTANLRANLLALARANWSMPPDHGAAVVRTVLESAALSREWRGELEAMRRRLADTRVALAQADARLAPLARQEGMFSVLPISSAGVQALRAQHAIYMAPSGRINIAGLNPANLDSFVAAIWDYL